MRSLIRGPVAFLLVLTFGMCLLPPAKARAGEREEWVAAARAALAELSSPDEAVRTKAADVLAHRPWIGAPELGRNGASLDDTAWTAVCDAFVRAGKEGYTSAAYLVMGARMAPAGQRERMIALARRMDPRAGVERTREEIDAVLHKVLVEWANARCSSGYELEIAVLGHQAVGPLLDHLGKEDSRFGGSSIACAALSMVAEEEDVPRIQELLLAGKSSLADTLESLQAHGLPAATDALLAALAAGRTDSRVTRALWKAPDPKRVVAVATKWIAGQDEVKDDARENLADLFMRLDAATTVPTLEAWSRTSRSQGALVSIAHALVHFGSRRGVELLVHIVRERKTRFPCRPSTPAEEAAAASPGRLCPEGFETYGRERAAKALARIAGPTVFDLSEDRVKQGPGRESEDDYLDRAGAAFRTWWESVRDTLRRDPSTGRWTSDE